MKMQLHVCTCISAHVYIYVKQMNVYKL